MTGLTCPHCGAIRTNEAALKIHLSIEHAGYTDANLAEAEKIDLPHSERILEMLEQIEQDTEVYLFLHSQKCTSPECETCDELTDAVTDLYSASKHVKKVGRIADLENLL
jgi:hypothetical protein